MDRRKLAAALAAGIALTIGVIVGISGDQQIVGTHRGGRYGSAGTHSVSLATPAYQTVYNVYSMNPALDHAAVNGVDVQDNAITAANALVSSGLGNVYNLDSDSTFAYAMVDTLWTAATVDTAAINAYRTTLYTLKATNSWDMVNATSSRPRPLIIHFDPKVPAGSSIVSARLHLVSMGWYTATTDTISATLMDKAGWNSWFHYRGIWSTWNNANPAAGDVWLKHHAKCGYSNQVQMKTAADRHGYHYTTRAPWTPALSTRNRFYDWGSAFDLTGLTSISGSGNHEEDQSIDITNCVQAIADGAANNGIMVNLKIASTANARSMYTYGFESPSNLSKAAWIEVKYSTRPNLGFFPGGKKWAFLFSVDDGLYRVNAAFIPVFKSHGGKYTIGVVRNYVIGHNPTPGVDAFTGTDTLLSWHDRGMEIVPHGYAHQALSVRPINAYDHGAGPDGYSASDTSTYASDWSAMKTEYGAAWLNSAAAGLGRDMSLSRRWGKSAIMPYFDFSVWTQVLSQRLGFSTVRVGTLGTVGAMAPSGMGRAFADTAKSGLRTLYPRQPRDVMLVPINRDISDIVGGLNSANEVQVKANMRKLCAEIIGNNMGVLALMTHDFRTGFDIDYDGTNDGIYTSGVNADQLGWILDVVVEMGGAIMTHTEYGDWVRACGTAVATPPATGSPWAPADTIGIPLEVHRFTAGQGVWIKPDGIDNRCIRGAKEVSVSGSGSGLENGIQDGETVAITGSGFGAKSPAAPLVWQRFETGSAGDYLSSLLGWDPYQNPPYSLGARISASQAHQGTRSAYGNPLWYGDYECTNNVPLATFQDTLFCSVWYRTLNLGTEDDCGVLKLTRFGTDGDHYTGPGIAMISGADVATMGSPFLGWYDSDHVQRQPGLPDLGYFTLAYNSWTRVDLFARLASAAGNDGAEWAASTGPHTRAFMSASAIPNRAAGQTYKYSGVLLPTMAANLMACTPNADFELYCDDLYIDKTAARVELGNNSVYASCSHLEIQIPTAWSDTGITFTANTGTFANGPGYLFVVTRDGVATLYSSVTIANA